MTGLVDPEFFGCGSKLSFRETFALANRDSGARPRDFSVDDYLQIVTSIDRVFMCARDARNFASIALNHALNDTNVGLAKPCHVMIAFEFERDSSESIRAEIADAFRSELEMRGIALGKCHSSFSSAQTSVTIAVIGRKSRNVAVSADSGEVLLSRPIGMFKMHYLSESGESQHGNFATSCLTTPFSIPAGASRFMDLTDISGHGLAGALRGLAHRNNVDIEVTLDASVAAHQEVLSKPTPCLQNFIGDFAAAEFEIDEHSWPLAGLMETAGPIVGLLGRDVRVPPDPFETGHLITIGRFSTGTGRVLVQWTD